MFTDIVKMKYLYILRFKMIVSFFLNALSQPPVCRRPGVSAYFFFFSWKLHRNAGVIREQQSCIVELWVMAVLVH